MAAETVRLQSSGSYRSQACHWITPDTSCRGLFSGMPRYEGGDKSKFGEYDGEYPSIHTWLHYVTLCYIIVDSQPTTSTTEIYGADPLRSLPTPGLDWRRHIEILNAVHQVPNDPIHHGGDRILSIATVNSFRREVKRKRLGKS